MQTRFVLFILFVISNITTTSFAQKSFTPYSEFGVRIIGGNYNIGLNEKYDDLLLGGGLGLHFLHVGERNLGVILEANYNSIGTFVANDIIETDQLTIPFFTHIYVPIKKSSIFLNVGPYISFNLTESLSEGYDPTDNSVFLGIGGGMGFKRNMAKSSISLEGRYYFNMTENYNQESNTVPKRTVWTEVALTYAFKL